MQHRLSLSVCIIFNFSIFVKNKPLPFTKRSCYNFAETADVCRFAPARNWKQRNCARLRRINFGCRGEGWRRSGATPTDDNEDSGNLDKQGGAISLRTGTQGGDAHDGLRDAFVNDRVRTLGCGYPFKQEIVSVMK